MWPQLRFMWSSQKSNISIRKPKSGGFQDPSKEDMCHVLVLRIFSLPAKPVLDLDGAVPDRPPDRPPARGGALAAHFSPAGWASPVSSTRAHGLGPMGQGPTGPRPHGPQDFHENVNFLGCRFLYPELLPDLVGAFSTYSRPDICHFGPKSEGFQGRGREYD